MSIESLDKLVNSFFEKIRFKKHDKGFENIMECPNEVGKGYIQEISLQPGLKLFICDLKPHKDYTITMEIENSPLGFSFFLSGNIRYIIERSRRQKNNFDVHSDQSLIAFYPSSMTRTEIMAEEPLRMVSISLVPALFNSFFETEFDQIPGDFRRIIDGSSENHYYRFGTISASMKIAIHQMLNYSYNGFIKRIFFEGLALELIAHLMALDTRTQSSPMLRPSDYEKVRHARDILIRNLENPPTLFELARSVGLTHTKLNQGFRRLYGTTAFGYLRRQRLEYGKLLLQEGKMNVAEVAYATGFSSPSHFARAFLKYFGIQPSLYLKDISRRMESSHP